MDMNQLSVIRAKKATLVEYKRSLGDNILHEEHAWDRCCGPPQEDVSKSRSRDLVIASRHQEVNTSFIEISVTNRNLVCSEDEPVDSLDCGKARSWHPRTISSNKSSASNSRFIHETCLREKRSHNRFIVQEQGIVKKSTVSHTCLKRITDRGCPTMKN